MPNRLSRLQGDILPGSAFAPATFQGNTFTPQQADMSLLARSLDKIEQRELATSQQRGAIAKALADVELNEAEDEWKTNYANKIQDEINGLVAFGDYSNALNRATILAGKALADPALRGRVRAQKEYKTFVDNTLSRKDLTEDDKSWALAMNPYKYEDKFDDKGNVVGGTNWKPTTRPVGEIDYNKLLATAKQLVFQESGGGTQVVFFDAEGKDTNNPLSAEGVKYYKNGQWQGISKNKLNQLLEAAIYNEPGARARLDQDWQVANWKYDQLSEEEKANNRPPELFSSNGRKYTKEEWYNNKFGRAIDAMSGMNYTSSIKYDDDYSNFMAARRAGNITGNGIGSSASDPFAGQIKLATGLGNPAIIETEDIVNKAFGKVTSGVQNLESIIPQLRNTQRWNNAKSKGDYDSMISLVKGSLQYKNLDAGAKANVDQKIRDLKDNSSLISSVKKQGGDFDAISFNGALTTGGELPSNNKYTKQYMAWYNELGGKNATALRYSFSNNNELVDFANKVGIKLDGSDCKKGTTEDGLPCITINKNNTKNYKALDLYNKLGISDKRVKNPEDSWWTRFWTIKRTNVAGVDKDGSITTGNEGITTDEYGNLTPGMSSTAHGLRNMSYIINDANKKASFTIGQAASNMVEVTTKNMELPGVLAARTQYSDDPSKQSSAATLAVDEAVNNIMGMHGSQYEMMLGDDTGNLRSSMVKDRTEALEEVQAYLTQNRSAAKDILGLKIVDGKVGYRIRIPKDWNKSKNSFVEGDISPNEIVIFNIDDPYLQKMQRDTRFVGTTRYDRLSRINGATHTTFDNNEVRFTNGVPSINGNLVNREAAIAMLSRDEGYNQLKEEFLDNITSNGTLTPGYANALASYIQNDFGYPIGSPANIEKAAYLINQMQNELK